MRMGLLLVLTVVVPSAAQAAAAPQTAAPAVAAVQGSGTPAPTPVSQADAQPPQAFKLDLDKLDESLLDRGHAEFEIGMRRFIWQDPMVRLEMAVQREQWRQKYAGLVVGLPTSISANFAFQRGVNPRLILAGPFASDWQDLTPQEKIGRIAESATYAGLVIGLLSWLGKR